VGFGCLAAFALLCASCAAVDKKVSSGCDTTAAWKTRNAILARIQAPAIPKADFAIADFGAVAGSGNLCTESIQRAIAACVAAGGGRVVVPKGEFLTGAIHLQSKVELHLDDGAVLNFSTYPRQYLPVVFTRFEGMECYNYSPLIYAIDAHDVAVTGSGTLDGQASTENWWSWKGSKNAAPGTKNQTVARKRLGQMVDDKIQVNERRFGEGSYLRPSFVEMYRCRNVLIEGVRIRRSPMWELHPCMSTNVIVRGVEIVSHGPNNDGCDPESCRDVLIENCTFDTGDDCVAIKSGRNNDGRRIGLPSENIVVRGCTMRDGHGGVVIGSEISGGCRNVFAEDCQMDSPHLERVLRLKSNAARGGVIENIYMRNVRVGRVADAVLQIDFLYEEGKNGAFAPRASNIVMERVQVKETPRVLDVAGFPGAKIEGVRVCNSTFEKVSKENRIQDAEDVQLIGCKSNTTARIP
jgi:polygalacturonase